MSVLRVYAQPKMAALLLLGAAGGFPQNLINDWLKAWCTRSGVDLLTIGAFGLVNLPFTFKFLWAPLFDRLAPPLPGRRRGWLLPVQVLLALATAGMGLQNPASNLSLVAGFALAVAFLAATQDLLIDGYRADVLAERESAAGSSLYVAGYRLATVATGSLALSLVDAWGWTALYMGAAAIMTIGLLGTLALPEQSTSTRPDSLRDAVVKPFLAFVRARGAALSVLALSFIMLFKLPDQLVNAMAVPFMLGMKYEMSDIGHARSTVGLLVNMGAVLGGGLVVARFGIPRCLWLSCILLGASNLVYWLLAVQPVPAPGQSPDVRLLYGAVVFDSLCAGFGTVVFLGYLIGLCDRRYSATQMALFTGIMTGAGHLLSPLAGGMAQRMGWPAFFVASAIAGLPGLALLWKVAPWNAGRDPDAGGDRDDAPTPPSSGAPAA